LAWGDGTYNFDHYDNNSSNNSQKNCRLVCKNCHGGATKTKKIAERNPYTGEVIGYRTIKLKVGYKKNPRKTESKTSKKSSTKTAKKSASKTTKKPIKKSARTKR
jgi:C4-type Zn-finger protein